MSEAAIMEPAFEKEQEPPEMIAPRDHPLWPGIAAQMRTVYDPEIPVNIYELGLIYMVEIDAENNVTVLMSLTAPGCPVVGEMPGMVQTAVQGAAGVNSASVNLVWDPPWNPSLMADTAKLTLNMY